MEQLLAILAEAFLNHTVMLLQTLYFGFKILIYCHTCTYTKYGTVSPIVRLPKNRKVTVLFSNEDLYSL